MRGRKLLVCIVGLLLFPGVLGAWGHRAHFTVNHGAIDVLPRPLRDFYHLNRPFVVRHAVDPDLWVEMGDRAPAHAPPAAAHFIDLDKLDNAPFDGIPKTYAAAVAKFGEERIAAAGTLPWEIAARTEQLTDAFREARWEDVLKHSAWIGHFIADATVPLHTTKNYKGQFSGNVILDERGPNRTVHHRLEWGLLEALPEHYDAVVGRPENVKPLDDVLAEAWRTIRTSYTLIPEVLNADREASGLDASFGPRYYHRLDERVGELVKRQLERSQEMVASVWLTAWKDAGRPALPAVRVIRELPASEGKEPEGPSG
ncbi:MAG TPA: hypothetical protein VMZ92_19440, partial [Planctomycetota bacterium]|nr:hypothetical protein [Planctomycetota bacterium]